MRVALRRLGLERVGRRLRRGLHAVLGERRVAQSGRQ
jgi:hypothetical protein